MRRLPHIIAALAIVAVACEELPEGILDQKQMTDLLVDIHKGESVAEMQRSIYGTDSMRKTLKQSILLAHNVTQEQLDSSFVWYGNHVEEYVEVYDAVILRLEEEKEQCRQAGLAAPVFAVGDSIDVWAGTHTYRLTADLGTSSIPFLIEPDENWEPGDNYTLQYKVINSRQSAPKINANIAVDYSDNVSEYRLTPTPTQGWNKVRLVLDSTRTATAIYGRIWFDLDSLDYIYLDSVSLVRTRCQRNTYRQRAGQRSSGTKSKPVTFPIENSNAEDTDASSSQQGQPILGSPLERQPLPHISK